MKYGFSPRAMWAVFQGSFKRQFPNGYEVAVDATDMHQLVMRASLRNTAVGKLMASSAKKAGRYGLPIALFKSPCNLNTSKTNPAMLALLIERET